MNEIKEPRSVRRNLSKLVVPIFIETLLIMMLGAVDTIMLASIQTMQLPPSEW